jgi:hypothetical protein
MYTKILHISQYCNIHVLHMKDRAVRPLLITQARLDTLYLAVLEINWD